MKDKLIHDRLWCNAVIALFEVYIIGFQGIVLTYIVPEIGMLVIAGKYLAFRIGSAHGIR